MERPPCCFFHLYVCMCFGRIMPVCLVTRETSTKTTTLTPGSGYSSPTLLLTSPFHTPSTPESLINQIDNLHGDQNVFQPVCWIRGETIDRATRISGKTDRRLPDPREVNTAAAAPVPSSSTLSHRLLCALSLPAHTIRLPCNVTVANGGKSTPGIQ